MTQENKHTPAPWSVGHIVAHNIYFVEDENGLTVCDLYFKTDNDYYRQLNAKANAHLIVAAPLMLAEMEKLAQALEDTGFEPDQSFYDVINKARGI